MLLNFQLGEDCPCPEEIREELYEFHDDLLIHCGEWEDCDTSFVCLFLALDRSVGKHTSMRAFVRLLVLFFVLLPTRRLY